MNNPRNFDDKTLFINKISYGVIVGLMTPLLFFLLNYIFRFKQYNFAELITTDFPAGALMVFKSNLTRPMVSP